MELIKRTNIILSILASIAMIIGIFYAVLEYHHKKTNDKLLFTIEAINQTKTDKFINSYKRLKISYHSQKIDDINQYTDDLNYVLNIYDNIAILCIHDLTENCMVKEAVYADLEFFIEIMKSCKVPPDTQKSIIQLYALLTKQTCKSQ